MTDPAYDWLMARCPKAWEAAGNGDPEYRAIANSEMRIAEEELDHYLCATFEAEFPREGYEGRTEAEIEAWVEERFDEYVRAVPVPKGRG